VRRFLTMLVLGAAGLFGLSALGLYGLSQGYFEAAVDHPPPLESPQLDTSEQLPSPERLAALAQNDPVAFLRACLLRYRKEVHGYRALLVKQERLNGKVGPIETIAVTFREEPFSVLLAWKTPPAGMADRALYVAGQNSGKALARGKLMHIVHHRDPYSPDAMAAGRYAMPDFGIAKGTERTLAAWQAAQDRGSLKVEYLGIRTVREVGDVPCHVLRRTCNPPEEEGLVTVETCFDTTHWLQVGNSLTTAGDSRIAAYYFRDLILNADFAPTQFDAAALKQN
jgi:hypothetical protein